MATGRKRSRLTRVLADAAQERFHACEVCHRRAALDSIEDALTPLRLKPRSTVRSGLGSEERVEGDLYDSTCPSAYNNPEAVGHNLVVFDPIPVNTIEGEAVFQFGEPDYDPFGLERWPLRRAPDMAEKPDASAVRVDKPEGKRKAR